MLLYALTIFASAFLLFLVQPLLGKYILPWFGGSPGVWTTCLLFFQTLLLGGYAYAHFLTTRLTPRRQAVVHGVLLVVSLAWLPVIPGVDWKPSPDAEPVTRILLLLGACVGLPYLVLSATGPLLQRWFSLAHPGVPPYRLYALSNTGSLLALLGYPFLIEPVLTRPAQGYGWSVAFGLFVLLCGACAWRVRGLAAAPAGPAMEDALAESDAAPTALDRGMWWVLPAVASALLLATTNKLCLDVAVVPFLWVLPLSLYLISFILCFDHPRWYSRGLFAALFAAGCGAIAWLLRARGVPIVTQAVIYSGTLFAACMLCHGELHRLRPAPRHLTRFYLSIAAGGAVGSVLVAVAAPLLLSDYYELQLGLALLAYLVGVLTLLYRAPGLARGIAAGAIGATLLVPMLQVNAWPGPVAWALTAAKQVRWFFGEYWQWLVPALVIIIVCLRDGWRLGAGEWRRRQAAAPLLLSVLLGVIFIIQSVDDQRSVRAAIRNFYGTLKVRQYHADEPAWRFNLLAHGETSHGVQFTDSPRAELATSYYSAGSGVGRVFDLLPGRRHAGLVGLGAGTLAAYGRPGDTLRFYDINPAVEPIAREHFSYLGRSTADVKVILGDARLVLEDELARQGSQQFDLLVLDAFSSDAIPVHLLTREAMAVYLAHLKQDGVIAVHISNRHLKLGPVVEGLARHYGLESATIADDPPNEDWWLYPTTWVLLTRNRALLEERDISTVTEARDESAAIVEWTDDHASLFGILK
jgi:hypothetical protein